MVPSEVQHQSFEVEGGGRVTARRITRTQRTRLAAMAGNLANGVAVEMRLAELAFRAAVVAADGLTDPVSGAAVVFASKAVPEVGTLCDSSVFDAVDEVTVVAVVSWACSSLRDDAAKKSSTPTPSHAP